MAWSLTCSFVCSAKAASLRPASHCSQPDSIADRSRSWSPPEKLPHDKKERLSGCVRLG